MNSIISCKNIHKSYGNVSVLKGIDLEVVSGEILAIAGPSGSGKTTLLQILGTLDEPDSKRNTDLIINRKSVSQMSSKDKALLRNKYLGFIFQFHELLPEFTALENVCLPSWISKRNNEEVRNDALKLLRELDLLKMAYKKPEELSGGERQRVAVARSLINNPEIIFADEPSGNLDSRNSDHLYELFFDLRKNKGCSFVIVTHNEKFAAKADRKMILKDGKIIR